MIEDDLILLAAQKLNSGEIIGLPTETVYGLAADARNPDAVRKVFELKKRPYSHPLITHISADADIFDWVDLTRVAADTHQIVQQLIEEFWPGPLTLVLPKSKAVDATVTGGQDTIALRSPNHSMAQAVLKQLSSLQNTQMVGIAAPSANHFGRVSPTSSAHVVDEFGGAVWVLDGQVSEIGIESTILDLSRGDPTILRLGHVTAGDIERAMGRTLIERQAQDLAPRVSGSMLAHYAPRTPLVWSNQYTGERAVCLCYSSGFQGDGFEKVIKLPNHARGYAYGLYHSLRELDEFNAVYIVIENLPSDKQWDAVRDRLVRAVVGSNSNGLAN